jgi:hypothetical protein
VSLIAHVGYDIEEIGPFLDAMERATRRLCVAVFMERQPASVADPFWPLVHGEERVPLPALPEFIELLRSRGADPTIAMTEREPREFDSREELAGFLRRQLWIADGGEKERRYRRALTSSSSRRTGASGSPISSPGRGRRRRHVVAAVTRGVRSADRRRGKRRHVLELEIGLRVGGGVAPDPGRS